MPKRQLQGTVVSDKGSKTIIVSVERQFLHPVYKKTIRTSKRYAAHDENNSFKTGDKVVIEESRPISKTKKWVVVDNSAEGSKPAATEKKAAKPAAAKKAPAKKKA